MKLILVFFMAIVIGIPLLMIISNQINSQSQLETINNDLFTMDNTSCVDVTTGCITSLTSVSNANSSIVVGADNYSLCNIDTVKPFYDGILVSGDSYIDLELNGLTLNATYIQSSDCSYISNTTSRNLSQLIIVFFVLALIAIGIWFVKENDMFGMGK